LEFKLNEDSGLVVLEVATRHASFWGWIDMCHDLGRVKKWPLQQHITIFMVHMTLVNFLIG